MGIDLITELAMGTAEIPESEPAEPVVVVVPIDPSMADDTYDVSVIRPASLPAADVAVTDQTTTEVELTVTRPDGYAGDPGLTVHVLCIKRTYDPGWVDVSAFLDPGWAGSAFIRKTASIVHFQFELTPQASIDGTNKTDSVLLIDDLDPTYIPSLSFAPVGVCFDNTNQILHARPDFGGDVYIEGTAGVTGAWADGVGYVRGQVSWVAG